MSENIDANFIYTLDKWSFYSEFGVSNKKSHRATAYAYLYKNEVEEATVAEDYRHPNKQDTNRNFNVSLGADYKIASGHTISLQSWLDGGKYRGCEDYQMPENVLLSANRNNYSNINTTSGLYYRGNIADRFIITSDFAYNYYHVNELRFYKTSADFTRLDYTGIKDFWRYNVNAYNIWNKLITNTIGYTYKGKSYINKDKNTGEELFRSRRIVTISMHH